MLILSRRPGEAIYVGDDIIITVANVKGDQVKLGIQAPRDILVIRDELIPVSPDHSRPPESP